MIGQHVCQSLASCEWRESSLHRSVANENIVLMENVEYLKRWSVCLRKFSHRKVCSINPIPTSPELKNVAKMASSTGWKETYCKYLLGGVVETGVLPGVPQVGLGIQVTVYFLKRLSSLNE